MYMKCVWLQNSGTSRNFGYPDKLIHQDCLLYASFCSRTLKCTKCIFSANTTVGLNFSANYSEIQSNSKKTCDQLWKLQVKEILGCLCQSEIILHEQVLGIFTAVA